MFYSCVFVRVCVVLFFFFYFIFSICVCMWVSTLAHLAYVNKDAPASVRGFNCRFDLFIRRSLMPFPRELRVLVISRSPCG